MKIKTNEESSLICRDKIASHLNSILKATDKRQPEYINKHIRCNKYSSNIFREYIQSPKIKRRLDSDTSGLTQRAAVDSKHTELPLLLLGTEHTQPEPETAAAWVVDCKLADNIVDNTDEKKDYTYHQANLT